MVNKTMDPKLEKDWAGLAILEQLAETGSELSSEEISAILGTRSVKGIGSALRQTRSTLSGAGIRLEEAVNKRSVRGQTVWFAGARLGQARHVLEQERFRWTGRRQQDAVPVATPNVGYSGPVLVLRALKSKEDVFRIVGGTPELDDILNDDRFEVGEGRYELMGEIFIDRIEPSTDDRAHTIPAGYGENGIWVRGVHDYARPRVATSIGTGKFPTMIACIGVATWVERRVALGDAVRQVEAVRAAEGGLPSKRANAQWHNVEEQKRFLYVKWIGSRGIFGPRSAPPLRMRLRCWYEIVIEAAAGERVVLHEEGWRGDDECTVARAIARWRESNEKWAGEPVLVRELRIARKQPRPMPP